ncbi:MAG: transporter substrate-binding domain-containing protein [Lachnospiraceae bacterium]|nr:transporter substrate-binding domain-containing protein [Lachnospiraceae bacterium]
MKKFKKYLALACMGVLGMSVLAGCGDSGVSGELGDAGSVDVTSGETVTFGTNAEFPPFEFVAASGVIDDFDGIDMKIAKQIGDDNGMTAKIENMEFDSLLIALENGQVDAVIAGMSITDERKEAVDFSTPYYTATQVMIVREDSDIAKATDMEGKSIAVIQGYTGEECVKELGYEYEAFKKGTETILELINGKCDVVVIDSATAQKYVNDNEGLKIVEDASSFESEEYGIAVKKGNTELLDKINTSIQKMLDEGTIATWATEYSDADSEDASDGSDEETSEETSEEAE